MSKRAITFLAAGLLHAGSALPAEPQRLHAAFEVYTGGIDFVSAEATLALGPAGYAIDVRYRTVGLLSVLHPGRQHNAVSGRWQGLQAIPYRYQGNGRWWGKEYVSLIDYDRGQPTVRTLLPPLDEEREPVPVALQTGTIDSLSALAGLMARVHREGRCDSEARLFDGRRVSVVTARTVGTEQLEPTRRSPYAGPALRCDFEAHVIAGHRRHDSAEDRARPFTGTAWFARPLPDAFTIPVRIAFETRALGIARMYLAHLDKDPDILSAATDPPAPGVPQALPSR